MELPFNLLTFFFSYFCFPSHSAEINWLKHFTNYLERDFEKSQVAFISDCKLAIQKMGNVQEIVRNIPSRITVYEKNPQNRNDDEDQDKNDKDKHCFKNPRVTTLFIMIPSSQQQLIDLSYLITLCASVRTRPKILVMFTSHQHSSNYETLLRQLWSKKFLDATILELKETTTLKKLLDVRKPLPEATLHQFNPFTGIYSRNEISLKTQWFPNKLQDLNGYQLKTGLFENPPDTNLEIVILNTLSEKINFSIDSVTSNQAELGISDCDKEKTTGLMYNITHGQIDLIANHVDGQSKCDLELIESSVAIRTLPLIVLVPILTEKTFTLTEILPFVHTVVIIGILVIAIWIFSHLMKFEILSDPIANLQVVLTQPLEHTPGKMSERIILGSLLIFCSVFSIKIYETAVNISFQREARVKLETLNDIEDAHLVPLLHPDWSNIFSNNSDETFFRFLNRSEISVDLQDEECVMKMVKNKSIVCIMDENYAKAMIVKYRDDKGNPTMKTAHERLMLNFYFMYFAPGSPYVERFDEILLTITRAGLLSKSNKNFLHRTTLVSIKNGLPPPESTLFIWEPGKFHRPLYLIITFGYLVSLVAFVSEIIIGRYLHKNHNH